MNYKKFSEDVKGGRNKWLTQIVGKKIYLVKRYGTRSVKVVLSACKGGMYTASFPSYLFISKISNFGPIKEDEVRKRRGEAVIRSIILSLKRCGVWQKIENKDFITVNYHNKNSDKAIQNRKLTKWKSL